MTPDLNPISFVQSCAMCRTVQNCINITWDLNPISSAQSWAVCRTVQNCITGHEILIPFHLHILCSVQNSTKLHKTLILCAVCKTAQHCTASTHMTGDASRSHLQYFVWCTEHNSLHYNSRQDKWCESYLHCDANPICTVMHSVQKNAPQHCMRQDGNLSARFWVVCSTVQHCFVRMSQIIAGDRGRRT